MTTVDDLAETIRDSHDIDTLDAAREVVTVFVVQISDDPDLWDAAAERLTDGGVEVVAGAIAQSYAQGEHGTAAQRLIEDIEEKVTAIEAAKKQVADLIADRDKLIRAALRTELPRGEIAAAADVKLARLHQINHGTR